MKIKLGELKLKHDGIAEILNVPLPVKTAYWLSKWAVRLESELLVFDKLRLELIRKHAKSLDVDGNPTRLEGSNQYNVDYEAFAEEYTPLANEEVEIDLRPIKLEALGDVQVSPGTMAKLGEIIEE